jgi:hypothetical protein
MPSHSVSSASGMSPRSRHMQGTWRPPFYSLERRDARHKFNSSVLLPTSVRHQ